MSVRKEELHKLVDQVKEKDAKLVYDLIKVVIDKDNEDNLVASADNSPLSESEKKVLKQAEIDIENDDLLDWEDIHE
ncbi:hypothetical protein QA612_22170 [Evansella sp. AB-P1]|uniref:hypothetical protein n=1 Tax=Evansella sp. AB-P1 TaxID=3037653 RepID=UPI00241D6BE0|nr:hypothetical protein [Evansella sp. AB-P1]MDG5790149.1 hypothetical protein [Evansella sp. AB-P1]